jgi:hypothetical protein
MIHHQTSNKDKEAERRLEKLVSAGCPRDEITAYLALLKLKTDDRQGLLPAGFTKERLGALPSRVERMAADLERLSQHKPFNPRLWFPEGHPGLRTIFTGLPDILRQYAGYIRIVTKDLSRFREEYRHGYIERTIIWMLIDCVRNSKGKPNYPALQTLLKSVGRYHTVSALTKIGNRSHPIPARAKVTATS